MLFFRKIKCRYLEIDNRGVFIMSVKSLLHKALELPPIERARLIEELLSSFEFSNRKEIDELWAQEAESRIEAYKKGILKSKPVHEVFEEINKMK